MSGGTGIEWTDETWNPVVGCNKTSPGCDNCYAIPQAVRIQRMGGKGGASYEGTTKDDGSDWSGTVKCLPARLGQPLRWRRPRRIFVNSMSDLFHPDVPEEFIGDVWNTMALAPQHTFQILTKRPQRMAEILSRWAKADWHWRRSDKTWCQVVDKKPLPNVWLGTSIESDRYSFRADHLRSTPGAVRWISAEPLLGPLPSLDLTDIDWLVVGGESGNRARPMHPDWVRELRGAYVDVGTETGGPEGWRPDPVKFFFKQWGSHAECELDPDEVMSGREHGRHGCQFMNNTDGGSDDRFTGGVYMRRQSKRIAGRQLDGRTWDEYPEVKS